MIELLAGLFILQAIIRITFWNRWITAYAYGMSYYRYNNWKGYWEIIGMFQALGSEMYEVYEAVHELSPIHAFEEICDVWHTLVCIVSIMILGKWATSPKIYYFIYMVSPLTAWKHGDRQLKYGCIRSLSNHGTEKGAHVCSAPKIA